MSAKCPRLHFEVSELPGGSKSTIMGYQIDAYTTDQDSRGRVGRHAGRITLIRRESGPPYVSHVAVDNELRRCGLAIYERAAAMSCREFDNTPLHSDTERSVKSDGFWQKQVRKGRAKCVRTVEEYGKEAWRTRPIVDDGGPVEGRSGCERYKLTCPAPTDLSRPPHRRRR